MVKLEIYTTEQRIDNFFHDQAWAIIMRKYTHLPSQERRERFRNEFPHHPIDYSHPSKSPSISHPEHSSDRRRITTPRSGGFDSAVQSLLPGLVSEEYTIDQLFAPLRLSHTQGWLGPSHLPKLHDIRDKATSLSKELHKAASDKGTLTESEEDAVIISDILVEFLDEAISLIERDAHIFMEKY